MIPLDPNTTEPLNPNTLNILDVVNGVSTIKVLPT